MKTKTKLGDLEATANIGTPLSNAQLDLVVGGLPKACDTGYMSSATGKNDSDPVCADK